jgi:hypothetical protein
MTPELRDAFRNTRYELQLATGTICLGVDQRCAGLGDWMRANDCSCAAWLTAFNPGSRARDHSLNAAAQQQLESRLVNDGYKFCRGTAVDPTGCWPPEPSVLVAGMSSDAALAIARDFGQVAFLWCTADATPRLVAAGQAER